MVRRSWAFVPALVVALAGCPGEKPAPPPLAEPPPPPVAPVPPPKATEPDLPVGLVALDAVDDMGLPGDVSRVIAEARARIPGKPSSEQRAALDEIESRYERLEAELAPPDMSDPAKAPDRLPLARVLAGFY